MSQSIFLAIFRAFGPNYWSLQGFRRVQLHWRIRHLEDLSIAFRPETSRGGSYHPDLSFDRVWTHLEAFFNWAELLRVFSVPAEHSITQLGGLVFHMTQISFCISLHCVFSLWRLPSSSREHFVAALIMFIGSICWSFQICIILVSGSCSLY